MDEWVAKHYRRIVLVLWVILVGLIAFVWSVQSEASSQVAFFQYEQHEEGLYKTCVYDLLGEVYTISIESIDPCPITITVEGAHHELRYRTHDRTFWGF